MQTLRTNLNNIASSQYTNWPFTSMIDFNGVLLGASKNGLARLCCGTTDDDTLIDGYIVTPISDFQVPGEKRARFAHFDFSCSGSLSILVELDGGRETLGPYTVTAKEDEGEQRRRISINARRKWKYAQIKVATVDGAAFTLDQLSMTIIKTAGGI